MQINKFTLLKKSRVALAILFFVLTFLSFIDLYELFSESFIRKILFLQFAPSVLKFIQVLSVTAIGFIVVLAITAFFGRIYCSAICPLGIIQDVFSFIAKRRSKKKVFFKYKKSNSVVRYSLLALTVVTFLFGTSLIVNLLDPYSNAGRIFTYLFKPFIVWGNNLVAEVLQNQKVYTLKIIERADTPWFLFIYTLLVFITIGYLSYRRGRLFCNLICPVGTFLGVFSKKALFRVNINSHSCTKCGKCSSVCKSECINLKTHSIDYTRCVTCYNCLTVCEDDAINYNAFKPVLIQPSKEKDLDKSGMSRRSAISSLLLLTASSTILAKSKDSGEYEVVDGEKLKLSIRKNTVSPPGSVGVKRFNSLCTACGLCISACPTNVLQPSLDEYGVYGLMQPFMDYAHSGFCNFDCNRCGEICPTGAILPLSIEDKQTTQLGKAIFVRDNCVVYRDETACGACSEHCPTKAVDMVPYKNGLVIPEVNQDICIGCGACEHPCPVDYPHKAIYIEGNKEHARAQKPVEIESSHKALEEDFPF